MGAALWVWIRNAAPWAASASELIQRARPWIITGSHFPLLLCFPLWNGEEPTSLYRHTFLVLTKPFPTYLHRSLFPPPTAQLHAPHFPGKPFLCVDALLPNRTCSIHVYPNVVQKLKITPPAAVLICLWKLSAAGGCSLHSEEEIQGEAGLSLSQGIAQNQGTSHDTLPRALHLCFSFISS